MIIKYEAALISDYEQVENTSTYKIGGFCVIHSWHCTSDQR